MCGKDDLLCTFVFTHVGIIIFMHMCIYLFMYVSMHVYMPESCSYSGVSSVVSWIWMKDPGQSEVGDLNDKVFGQEDVSTGNVSMHDLHMSHAENKENKVNTAALNVWERCLFWKRTTVFDLIITIITVGRVGHILHRNIDTFCKYFMDVTTSVWALTETLLTPPNLAE